MSQILGMVLGIWRETISIIILGKLLVLLMKKHGKNEEEVFLSITLFSPPLLNAFDLVVSYMDQGLKKQSGLGQHDFH